MQEAENAGFTLLDKTDRPRFYKYKIKSCGHIKVMRTDKVRDSKRIKCDVCITEKRTSEAKKKNFTYLESGKGKKGAKYKCNKCGSIQEIYAQVMRENNVRCHNCLIDKYKDYGKKLGLTFIKKVRGDYKAIYKFDKCGHETIQNLDRLKSLKTLTCIKCFEETFRKEAKERGLELLKKTSVRKYLYRIKACGHEQEFRPSNVRDNLDITCKICLYKRHEKEARDVGLKLIGFVKGNNRKRLYEFKKCKHKQEISISHVRMNNFICNTCHETYMSLPSTIYLLEINLNSFSFLKLGYAKDVKRRKTYYGLPKNSKVENLKIVNMKTGKEAMDKEKKIHMKFRKYKIKSEQMKKYMISGFDECYPVELKENLLNELK